jgi:hypothetical protein
MIILFMKANFKTINFMGKESLFIKKVIQITLVCFNLEKWMEKALLLHLIIYMNGNF